MKSEHYAYSELIAELGSSKPSYDELLNTIEWKEFREVILNRDETKCHSCKTEASYKSNGKNIRNFTQNEIQQEKLLTDIKYELKEPDFIIDGFEIKLKPALKVGEFIEEPIVMHIHHKFYILGNLPWEYDPKHLVTLCNLCHTNFHKNNVVPFYSNSDRTEKLNLTKCKRCSGSGHFSEYNHVIGGTCFRCRGAKYEELIGCYK